MHKRLPVQPPIVKPTVADKVEQYIITLYLITQRMLKGYSHQFILPQHYVLTPVVQPHTLHSGSPGALQHSFIHMNRAVL